MTAPTKTLPKLRFPEFKNDGEWKVVKLGEIAKRITLKNKDKKSLPVLTNSASGGIVKQEDYFDREIVSNDNLINYYIVSDDDFVYNPRISTIAPVGPISRNKIGKGVMSPLYTVFRFVEGNVDFFEHYFKTNNWHQYLKDKANFGARFDRMNITTEDFISLPIPFPSLPEQQKIASLLTSLDEQISANTKKMEALKAHKKSLMQQLFPANGEKTPKLRFPEFKNAGEWDVVELGKISDVYSGGTPNVGIPDYYNGSIPFIRSGEIKESHTKLFISQNGLVNSSAKMVAKGDILYALYGATSGEVAISQIDGAINQAILAIIPHNSIDKYLICQILAHKKSEITNRYLQGGQGNLSAQIIKSVTVSIPKYKEQQKIASFLSSIDDMIQAQDNKIQKLKTYKNGLMQQLFA